VGPSYTAHSGAIADEECINLFAETLESQGSQTASKAYGGASAQALRSYYGTPGLRLGMDPSAITTTRNRMRGIIAMSLSKLGFGGQAYGVLGDTVGELFPIVDSPFGYTVQFAAIPGTTVVDDGKPVSMACNGQQILIVSAGHAYCLNLLTAPTFTDVTSLLQGTPIKVEESDSYFIVTFDNTNEFQMSAPLDGLTWPGLQVNAVEVFPENIVSIITNHRELWVMGSQHIQPYQNTGSDNVFDVIPGTLIEKGCAATFAPCRLDNSIFWVDEDERGGRSAWRSNGYTPVRVSTYAVEADLATYSDISGMTTYAYQDGGHLFWVLYIPGSQWSWVYDVPEGLWHKRASWSNGQWGPHHSWNHVYAFGKHLVGDWASGNLYEMDLGLVDDNGAAIRRLRRAPTVSDEMQWIYHSELTVDIETGLGPQPPLTDGNGNPRAPQAMLRWSDDRGRTWSNEHVVDCGMAGQFKARAIWRRLGRSRYRVYELSVSDPIQWAILDAYLRTAGQ